MQIKQKLNNNAGASMILALALLLVCVVVSSMVVSTAASGLNRTEKRVTQQQEYLAVSSAATLIAEELKSAGIGGTLVVYEPLCWSYYRPDWEVGSETVMVDGVPYCKYPKEPFPVELVQDVIHFLLEEEAYLEAGDVREFFCPIKRKFTVTTESTGSFGDLLQEACEYVVGKTDVYEKEFSMFTYLSDNPNALDERLPEVQCKFVMDTEFGIQVHVFVKESEAKSDYAMIVKLQAIVNREETGVVVTASCENDHIVLLNTDDVQTLEDRGTETPCVNLTINWPNPQIIKGAKNS